MDTNQIYSLVNDAVAQGTGQNGLTAIDAQSLISLGNVVLSSSANTEAFLGTLAQRIGRTILRFRKYNNKLSGLVLDDFEYGAIVQKIRVAMPDAESDQSYGLTDGQAVDHYKVAKPEVLQKLFVTRTPYQFHVTIQREHLREAFMSPEAMGGFISVIFGEVQNAIDYALERLGRAAISNFIAESYTITPGEDEDEEPTYTGKQNVVNLGTLYKALNTEAADWDYDQLLNSDDFHRFAISEINRRADMMEEMSVLNLASTSGEPTFTPRDKMYIFLESGYRRRMETVAQYAAFNERFLDIGAFDTLTYWQNASYPRTIQVTRASDGEDVNMTGIVGVMYDRDALGIYKMIEEVLTTPVNAAGMYYNQYYHERQLWFNDLSENFVVFTLN